MTAETAALMVIVFAVIKNCKIMTSINFHFRPSTRAGYCEGKLFIRVIHNRKPKNIVTDYKLLPHEWDQKGQKVLLPENDHPRLIYLNDIRTRMSEDLYKLRTVVDLLSRQGNYTVEDIAAGVRKKTKDGTLWSFSETLAEKLRQAGRVRTARAYRTAVKSLIGYNKGADLPLAELDEGLILRYEKHLKDMGRELNTISFYMRNLRAIYFKAVRAKMIGRTAENPFIHVYTGVSESKKKALSQQQIHVFSRLETELDSRLNRNDWQSNGRDRELRNALLLFMFSYHARGMSFVDVAYLKKSDIADGRITYRRHKTGGQISLHITEPMRRIMNTLGNSDSSSEYVFPVIDLRQGPARVQYETGLRLQNKRLKVLGHMAGIEHLSTHVARHTWATLAKKSLIDIQVISEALGHKDTKTTQRYLDSFDQSTLDKVSEQMSGLVGEAA